MKSEQEILAELAVVIELEPDEEIAAAAVDRLGFPEPSEEYDPELVRRLVLDLERRREAGALVREYGDDGLGLLYYEPAVAARDEASRVEASVRKVQEIAGSMSAAFVRPRT